MFSLLRKKNDFILYTQESYKKNPSFATFLRSIIIYRVRAAAEYGYLNCFSACVASVPHSVPHATGIHIIRHGVKHKMGTDYDQLDRIFFLYLFLFSRLNTKSFDKWEISILLIR